MVNFAERTKYLKNDIWRNKPKLPLKADFKLKNTIADTEIVYDFESQGNIYSISALYVQLRQLVIWYYTNNPNLVDEQAVLIKAHKINDLTIANYEKILHGPVQLMVKKLTFADLQLIFENPKRYVVGFNSNYYDLPLASYILAYGYAHEGQLPIPAKVRTFSNLLINPQKTITSNPESLGKFVKPFNIDLKRRIGLWDLAKFFDYTNSEQTNDNICIYQGDAPNLAKIYRYLQNTGLHLDIKSLNEKDKDMSQYTSLKRIAAQFGYQIEEPEEVDLSSDDNLTTDQATTLLAYNASDVLVTMLIYQNSSYQDPLSTREDLLNTFDETNFKGRLSVNSTSAQFVELIIAPDAPLVDQDEINFFYPIHGKKYQHYQSIVDKDYINRDVPEDKNQYQHFKCWLQFTHPEIFADVNTQYNQAHRDLIQHYPQYNIQNSNDYIKYTHQKENLNKQFQEKIKQIINQMQKNYQYLNEYCYFLNNNTNYANLPLVDKFDHWPNCADRLSLDLKWTASLQNLPNFKPVMGLDNKMHPFTRVRYGEIQLDLLEFMRMRFDKFPKEVYELYSYLRGAKTIYDRDNQGNIKLDKRQHQIIVKTAREVGTENFVNHYLPILGKDSHGKAIAPPNIYYKFKTSNQSVTGAGAIIQVPNRPMVLSFSVGGVHGEVMNDQAYLRDKQIVERYNHTLNLIKTEYPIAQNFYDAIINGTLNSACQKQLNVAAINKINIKTFITKTSKKIKYKAFKKPINPKDYVIPIDMHNAVHVDVDSLYPSLMINLHLFSTWTNEYNDPQRFVETDKTGHWYDVYAKKRQQRVEMKKFALETPKNKWGYEQKHAWSIQLTNKLILNSASGIADGRWPTNVRMNNKATSMRIMGQLALTYLVYRVEPKGVYSTSTNTDGVYLTSNDPNFTEKDVNNEIEEWKSFFHLGATPEIMGHFVSKDSNNRFEQETPKEIGAAAGATIGNFTGPSSAKKMTQPFIIDAGIINYFKTHNNVCKTYDIPMNDLLEYLKKQQAIIVNATTYTPEVNHAMLSFCWPMQPQTKQKYCLANKPKQATHFINIQHVNRFIITNHGYYLRGFSIKPLTNNDYDENLTNWCIATNLIDPHTTNVAKQVKVTNFKSDWQVNRLNLDLRAYFKSPVWQDLNLNAYADFTRSRILGTDSQPIWVEPKFKPLNIANNINTIVK